ncbi:MAG: hypothetical protein BWY86_01459 [Candidatus Aminicenantes bacterium ADurb.Bin508]|nr:MAG: hypothetical protein BWY86_01459 [Candidatus Aminicenantes bacterium ADurb.Bin508]
MPDGFGEVELVSGGGNQLPFSFFLPFLFRRETAVPPFPDGEETVVPAVFLSSEVCRYIDDFSPFQDSSVLFPFSGPFFSQGFPVFFGYCPHRLLEFLSHGTGDPYGDVSEPLMLPFGAPGEKVRLVSGAVAPEGDSLYFLRQVLKDPFQLLLLLPAGRDVPVAVPRSRHKVVFGTVGVQGLVALLSLVVPVGSTLFRLDERGVLVEGDVPPGLPCRREGEEP